MTTVTEQTAAEWIAIQHARRVAEEEYFQHRDLGNPLYYLDVLRDEALAEMRSALSSRTASAASDTTLTPAAKSALGYILDRFVARARNGSRLTEHERAALQMLRDAAQPR